MKYKYGEKVRNWRYKFVVDYVSDDWLTTRRVYTYTGEKVYYGIPYLFRAEPVPGIHRYKPHMGKKCGGNGKGTPWKKDFVKDRLYQREVLEEYGTTFTMPDKIPCKYGYNNDRSWKRTKKSKQWMKGDSVAIIRKEKEEDYLPCSHSG